MTKSDLIERLTSKHFQLSIKEVEDSVKETLQLMTDSLAKGELLKLEVLVVSHYIIVLHVLDVILKQEIKSN